MHSNFSGGKIWCQLGPEGSGSQRLLFTGPIWTKFGRRLASLCERLALRGLRDAELDRRQELLEDEIAGAPIAIRPLMLAEAFEAFLESGLSEAEADEMLEAIHGRIS